MASESGKLEQVNTSKHRACTSDALRHGFLLSPEAVSATVPVGLSPIDRWRVHDLPRFLIVAYDGQRTLANYW